MIARETRHGCEHGGGTCGRIDGKPAELRLVVEGTGAELEVCREHAGHFMLAAAGRNGVVIHVEKLPATY